MTTSNISFDPALHAYVGSDQRHVLDLVLQHQIPTLTALEILQHEQVLPTWTSNNIIPITNARQADDTRDWYFPILVQKAPLSTATRTSWSWSGIHHLTEHQASETIHPLPSLTYLPPLWKTSGGFDIIASAGGLLLITPRTASSYCIPSVKNVHSGYMAPAVAVPVRRSRLCLGCSSGRSRHRRGCSFSVLSTWGTTRSRRSHADSTANLQNWKPLLVCNPLTNTWRELPAVNWGPSMWSYDEVRTDMVADERANSYRIILTFRSSFCMCVYKSTSNSWACRRYQPCPPLASRELAWRSHMCASAVVRGRLHYAFLEYRHNAATLAVLRVFEIDEEAGEWKPHNLYPLKKRVWGVLVNSFVRRVQRFYGRESGILPYLELVECMGDMYAVIPSRLDEIVANNLDRVRVVEDAHRSHREDCEAMPIQFHILGLDCDTVDVNGVLRIQVPKAASDVEFRRLSLLQKTSGLYQPPRNWFSCTARGSVIWVTCEDYLLRYDVVSGESKTQIILKRSLVDAGVSYRPSFHMKP